MQKCLIVDIARILTSLSSTEEMYNTLNYFQISKNAKIYQMCYAIKSEKNILHKLFLKL